VKPLTKKFIFIIVCLLSFLSPYALMFIGPQILDTSSSIYEKAKIKIMGVTYWEEELIKVNNRLLYFEILIAEQTQEADGIIKTSEIKTANDFLLKTIEQLKKEKKIILTKIQFHK